MRTIILTISTISMISSSFASASNSNSNSRFVRRGSLFLENGDDDEGHRVVAAVPRHLRRSTTTTHPYRTHDYSILDDSASSSSSLIEIYEIENDENENN